MFLSANRDAEVFEDPDTFRIDRNPNPHLGFGYGLHYCLGALLAKLELRYFFDELLNRIESDRACGRADVDGVELRQRCEAVARTLSLAVAEAAIMSIDLESIVAIDVHTHAQVPRNGAPDPITMHVLDAAAKHFRSDFPRPNAQEVAEYYRDRKMAAVIFCVDSEHNTGEVPVPNDEMLDIAAANGDVLIPFVSVDPHRGNAA